MVEKTANLHLCDDLIPRCDKLLKQNFAQYHNCIKLQEVLRLEFIGTNNDYKYLKTWLDIAYEDILTSKSKHGFLIQHYEVLSKNNIITEFLNFANDQEILQLKFIETVHQCKDFRADLDASNEFIKALKSEYNDSSQHTRSFGKRSKALRLKFIEGVDECERLKKCLDAAHESTVMLNSEHDDLTRCFRVLFEKKEAKEFLNCAKYQEKLQLKYIENSNESECSESCQSQANKEVVSLNLKLVEIREMISKERLLIEKVEKQRDSLDYLSAELCLLLLKYQRLTASDKLREQYSMIDEAMQKSANMDKTSESSNTIIEFDSSNSSYISITEWKIDKKEINDVNFESSSNEVENESAMKKMEKENVNCELELSFSDGVEYSNHNNSNCSESCTEKLANTKKKRDLSSQEKNSSHSELSDDIQKSQHSRTSVLESPLTPFICEKCGKAFTTKSTEQRLQTCPVCDEHSKNRIHKKTMSTNNTNDDVSETVVTDFQKKQVSYLRCDIFCRDYPNMCELKELNCIACERLKLFKCNDCNQMFARRDAMQSHATKVHRRDVNYYDCAYCGKRYMNRKTGLEYHIYTKHSENFDKPYKCTICGASFAVQFLLTKHKNEKHDSVEISGLRCDICDINFLRKSYLKHHNLNMHRKRPFSRRRRVEQIHSTCAPSYFCEHCNKQYVRKHHLAFHIHSRHFSLVKPFKCTLCDKTFMWKTHLKIHQFTHSTEKPFKCSTCDQRFNHPGNKTKHERTVHDGELPLCCAHCDKRFSHKSHLSDHIHRSHFSGLSKSFKCTICEKAFAKSYKLKRHVKMVHLSERPFKCSWCDKYFKDASQKKRHESTLHTNAQTVWLKCPQCDKHFPVKEYLRSHIRNQHATEPVKKSFECPTCKKMFASKSSLKIHKSIHSSEKPYKCSFCDHRFKTEGYKRTHERRSHDENFILFECAHCGKSFRYKRGISVHIQVAHSRNEKPFKCAICKKAFACKLYVQLHQRTHSSKKNYKCPKCDKCFKTPQGKQLHMRATHEGGRFTCSSCDKMYNCKADISRHIRNNHL